MPSYNKSKFAGVIGALSALLLLVPMLVAYICALSALQPAEPAAYIGIALYVLLCYALFIADLFIQARTVLVTFKKALILALMLAVMPPLTLLGRAANPYVTPMLLGIMLIATLVGERAALSSTALLAAIAGLLGAEGDAFGIPSFTLLAVTLAGGVATTYALRRVQTRVAIIAAGGIGAAVAALCVAAIGMLNAAPAPVLLMNIVWVILPALLCALLVVGSLPVWENVFDVATAARLNELLNTNQPLLKQLMYEAPGTYQHSMNVAALAESAAERIGADPLLARVGACYHDVGKLRRPQYFKENQPGENIHDTLPPEESAAIILAHQRDGAIILAKNKLPGSVVRIAAEHHGNSLVAYFYYKAQSLGGEADAKKFRYPGNRPSSREGAIVLLADCCEAAVRSLGETTKEAREELVHKVIWSKLTDGDENLLSDAPLTLSDVSEIERSFLRTFSGIMHDRIEYPEEKKA
ncbi:MAG: HDIG domain-containing protein [Christensenellaceae bacterium]|nr:HDIG domain-containing protein [Christensenellaceae bacterium]